ncbi:MAG: TetR/AcrR family transcriptional regulator [Candidatus Dormibacteraeota bacterium]|nr:TetR/AcrR family transcriptional regulator [Candidatus Dormibacteraeota bacterium]
MGKAVKRPHVEPPGRIAIAEAARRLFKEGGYASTTIDAIAAEAGYAVQTVYFHFKSKAAIVQYLVGRMKAETISPAFQRSMKDQPAEARLRALARTARQTAESWWDVYEVLRSASQSDDALRALVADMDGGRLYGQRRLAKALAARAQLGRGIDVATATDVIWTLASEDTYRRLVVERKWSPHRYEEWLSRCLSSEILSEHRHGPRR